MSYRVVMIVASRDDENRKKMMKLYDQVLEGANNIKLAYKYYFNDKADMTTYKEIASGLYSMINEISPEILESNEFITNVSIEPEFLSAIVVICKPEEYRRNPIFEEVIEQEVKDSGLVLRTIKK